MMQIKDYIFYRMYLAYKKHEDGGRIEAILYFILIEYFLFAPIYIIIAVPFFDDNKKIIAGMILFIPMIIIFALNIKRYFKEGKVDQLKSKFKNSKYNRIIKNWMLYLLPFFAGAWGLLGIMPISKFLQLILSLIKG